LFVFPIIIIIISSLSFIKKKKLPSFFILLNSLLFSCNYLIKFEKQNLFSLRLFYNSHLCIIKFGVFTFFKCLCRSLFFFLPCFCHIVFCSLFALVLRTFLNIYVRCYIRLLHLVASFYRNIAAIFLHLFLCSDYRISFNLFFCHLIKNNNGNKISNIF
jgi:hypothetical protein